jgi:hypothetical protein
VFCSLDALINPLWMKNEKVRDAVNELMNVKIERKKDGVHLIASLQQINKVELF